MRRRLPVAASVFVAALVAGCANDELQAMGDDSVRIDLSYGADPIVPGTEITFELTQSPLPASDAHWAFGDGAEAEGTVVTHAYDRPGVYPLRVSVQGFHHERPIGVNENVTVSGTAPATFRPPLGEPIATSRNDLTVYEKNVGGTVIAHLDLPSGIEESYIRLLDADGHEVASWGTTSPVQLYFDEGLPAGSYVLEIWMERAVLPAEYQGYAFWAYAG